MKAEPNQGQRRKKKKAIALNQVTNEADDNKQGYRAKSYLPQVISVAIGWIRTSKKHR